MLNVVNQIHMLK